MNKDLERILKDQTFTALHPSQRGPLISPIMPTRFISSPQDNERGSLFESPFIIAAVVTAFNNTD